MKLRVFRTASYKALTVVGLLASSTGYVLLITLWHGKTNFWESLYIMPGGFGTGVAMATTFVSLAAGVDETQMAIASAGFYQSANIGGLVGASLASSVLQTSLKIALNRELKGIPDYRIVILSLFYRLLDSDLHRRVLTGIFCIDRAPCFIRP